MIILGARRDIKWPRLLDPLLRPSKTPFRVFFKSWGVFPYAISYSNAVRFTSLTLAKRMPILQQYSISAFFASRTQFPETNSPVNDNNKAIILSYYIFLYELEYCCNPVRKAKSPLTLAQKTITSLL